MVEQDFYVGALIANAGFDDERAFVFLMLGWFNRSVMKKNVKFWVCVGLVFYSMHSVGGAQLDKPVREPEAAFIYSGSDAYDETKIFIEGPQITARFYSVTITQESDEGDRAWSFSKCQLGARSNLVCQNKHNRMVIKNTSSSEIEVTWQKRTCSSCTCNPRNKNPHWSVETFVAKKISSLGLS